MYSLYKSPIWRKCNGLYQRNFLVKARYCSKPKEELTFSHFIERRRLEAARSIVVQVQSENSFGDLYNYCNKFGNIIGAYHYNIREENSNYILIEYDTASSVNGVLDSADYNSDSNGIPTRSSLLWFKAASSIKEIALKNSTKSDKVLKISNGAHDLSDSDVFEYILSAENVSDQVRILYESTKLNDLEVRLRFLASRQIENSISGMFPNACALPFGSSVNGFGKMGCDLDLVLCFQRENTKKNMTSSRLVFHSKENLTNERSQIQKQMESISDILQIFLPGITHVRRILQARVPIIKFHHLILNLEIDLTMNNLSGVYMSELLYILGEIDHRVRPLIFTIRKWGQSVGLTNPSPGRWITNFSLSCLVIFFLQQTKNPLLPSVDFLNKSATTDDVRFTDDGIDCTFLRNYNILNFETKNDNNLSELLLQFFEFYSQFDFNNRAISLNKGVSVTKPDHSPLYIANPFDQCLNVSKNISFEECERLRIEVRNAAWILENEAENINLAKESSKNMWGIAKLFKSSQKSVIKPNIFFKPRLVEISDIFEGNSNENEYSINTVKNIKVLEANLPTRDKINKGKES